jgi:hypothetical protein
MRVRDRNAKRRPVEGRKFLPVSITRIHSHNQDSDRNINDRLIKRKSNKISYSITKKKKIIITIFISDYVFIAKKSPISENFDV